MDSFLKYGCILVLCCVVGIKADEYHDNQYAYSASANARPDLGQGLHKIPFTNWKTVAKASLDQRLAMLMNQKKAKNIIFFIGDGMGIATLSVARLHKSQKENITMDKVHLAWDKFLHAGIVKTYNSDQSVADSAGTATAFMCGEKARAGIIGMDELVPRRGNCSLYTNNDCKSSVQHAMDAGKWTGVVSTARLTHATPACAYAHSPDRNWEYDLGIPDNLRSHCEDIAHQLIYKPENHDIRVLMGGGRTNFMKTTDADPEYGSAGYRGDINLVDEWLRIKRESGVPETEFKYVYNQTEFDSADPEKVKYLFGLFEPSHMKYEADRATDRSGEPSLAEMVEKSINMLKKSPNGYLLYVEGGRIDHAHHAGTAQKAMIDTWALSDAVQKAVEMADPEETLIVVSSDHSHVMTLNGYPHIDSDIYGVSYDTGGMQRATDGLPHLSVSYANGPGHSDHQGVNGARRDLTNETKEQYDNTNYRQSAMVPLTSETHGGEDVGVFARGPWAHLFSGTVEQNYLAVAMMHAACIGPDPPAQHCQDSASSSTSSSSSTSRATDPTNGAATATSLTGLIMFLSLLVRTVLQ